MLSERKRSSEKFLSKTLNAEPRVLSFYLPAMLVFLVLRLCFFAFHFSRFAQEPVSQILKAFAFGAMIDSSIAATTLLPFFLIQVISSRLPLRDFMDRGVHWGVRLAFGFQFLINATDIFYFQHAHSRANVDLFEQFSQLGPIWQTMIGSKLYLSFVVAGLALTIGVLLGFDWLARRLVVKLRFPGNEGVVFLALLVATFLYLPEPFWRLPWVSSATQAMRQLKLNGVYSLIEDYRMKSLIRDEYRELASMQSESGAFEKFRSQRLGPSEHFTNDQFPLARRIDHPHPLGVTKPNIVLVVMEGFSASKVGVLRDDQQGLSPNLDRLAREGILFTNFYAHEMRTHHGVVGISASFPSLIGGFLTRRYGTDSFYTGFNLLREYGYRTSFIYGYDSDFDNKASFFSQGGVDEIIDQSSFSAWKYKGVWGVSDEDVFARANQRFRSYPKDQPFVSMILTGSNHAPYHLPDYYAKTHPELRNDYDSTFSYADWAIGNFIEQAKKEAYFEKTVFVFVADHGEEVDSQGKKLKRFHIPCVVYAPKLIPTHREIAQVGAQIDIFPTLFHLIGYPYDFHFVGRNLLTNPSQGSSNFAIMAYGTDFLVRWKDYVLVDDARGMSPRLYSVKGRSYLGERIDNPEIQNNLSMLLKNYRAGLYHVFYQGLHQVSHKMGSKGSSPRS